MPSPGTVLDGKYRLVRQLGEGGMGIVFEADHIRLRQPFAIKVLQPEFASEREFLMRFEREARAAAQLRGPHIVRVFDVDASPDGLTYMVMELLEGRDLSQEATEAPVPLPQLVDWIIQTCSGLQEAHDNGIVHRDLKPANIFLARIETGERIAKVLDFGISKVEATSTSHLTSRAQGALGTPTYMAPEQIRNRRVDGRADLWALGVILYRLLGSRWPFSGKGDQGYMAAVLSDPPLPFEMVRPDLPYELASVIMKALEKDVARRYASAIDMALALAPFGTGRAVLPSRTSLPAGPVGPGLEAPEASLERRFPLAIVMPGGMATRVDRAGVMDTVIDAPRKHATEIVVGDARGAPLGGVSPPATVFAPPLASVTARPRTGAGWVIVGACVAATAGFVIYTAATARSHAERVTPPPVVTSALDELPPAALELPAASVGAEAGAEARPAATGVPIEPSPSSSAPRRRAPRSATAAAPASASVVPTVAEPAIPDHL
jgi:hypothetical protein